jgi:hypothetical protein
MNAAKALLSSKNIRFVPYHGVSGWKPNPASKSQAFSVGVTIKKDGILPSLAAYYGEKETAKIHLLKDILYNLPFIHRTYCLTYSSCKEMFIPLIKPAFVIELGTCNVFFSAQISPHFRAKRFTKYLPASLTEKDGTLISVSPVVVSSVKKPTATDLQLLSRFAQSLRDDVFYINGMHPLWYVKTTVSKARVLRQTTTLTLAMMHRLSEVCRYAPMELTKYLEGQKNWLLSEFIRMSGTQFIDEMASEITGKNFLVPNVRPAN